MSLHLRVYPIVSRSKNKPGSHSAMSLSSGGKVMQQILHSACKTINEINCNVCRLLTGAHKNDGRAVKGSSLPVTSGFLSRENTKPRGQGYPPVVSEDQDRFTACSVHCHLAFWPTSTGRLRIPPGLTWGHFTVSGRYPC